MFMKMINRPYFVKKLIYLFLLTQEKMQRKQISMLTITLLLDLSAWVVRLKQTFRLTLILWYYQRCPSSNPLLPS